ncbi:MAG: DUF2029 domain-containing protein [Proteobacteria bacterium]|nr:DUF2029 domain-containing protein [Pseudomonadota bacterium]
MIPPMRRIDIPSVFALLAIAVWAFTLNTARVSPKGWITTPQGLPANGDYLGIYSAGQLVGSGDLMAPYDPVRHKGAQRALDHNPNGGDFPWSYPPTFLLAAAALALVPYAASMLTWICATLSLLIAALARISTSRRDLLLMLATPGPWLNFYIGQNGALTSGLLGFGLVLLETKPILAGVAIGLLSFKPHLGLLIPIALIAGGYYHSIAAAALTVAAMVIASIAAFGVASWLALPKQLQHVASLIATSPDTERIQTPFGLARGLGLSADHALWLQAAVSAALVVVIGWLWSRRTVSFDLKAAALAAAITLATPYLFVYDLVMLTVAQAFLLRHLSRHGMTRVDAYGLLLANVFILFFSKLPPVPLGVFGSFTVMALILRHVWIETTNCDALQAGEKNVGRAPTSAAIRAGRT